MGLENPAPREAVPDQQADTDKFHQATEEEVAEVTDDMTISAETVTAYEQRMEEIGAEKERLAADIESLAAELNKSRREIDQAENSIMSDLDVADMKELIAETDVDQFVHDYTRGEMKLTETQEMFVGIIGLDRSIEMVSVQLQAHELKSTVLQSWQEKMNDLEAATDQNASAEQRAGAMLKKTRRKASDIGAKESVMRISGM